MSSSSSRENARRTVAAFVAGALALTAVTLITVDGAAAAGSDGRIAVLEATQDSSCTSGVVLRTIKPDGTDPRTLAPAFGGGVSWSPDGTRLAFDDGSAIKIIDADGSHQTAFASGTHATWSPDGTQLAYQAGAGDHSAIFRKPVAGGPAVQVEPLDRSTPFATGPRSGGGRWDAYARGDINPAWSPTGDRIAFSRIVSVSFYAANGTNVGSDDKIDIYSTHADGSSLRQLSGDNAEADDGTDHNEISQLPTWAPDGGTVAFSFARPDAAPTYYGNEVGTVPADGGPTTLATTVLHPRNDRTIFPTYSPSGRFAYAALSQPAGSAYGIYAGDQLIYTAPHGICGLSWGTAVAALPTAAFTATLSGAVPHDWSFDGTASHAPSGTIASYHWTFGDGTNETTTTPTTTHTYADGSTHTASLVVVDADGVASSAVTRDLTEPRLVVNSTGDDPALHPAAGCDTGNTVGDDDAECTLRAAIQAVDAGAGSTITFSLPGSTTISPATLPTITAAGATIDGTSQPSGTPTISGAGLEIEGAAGVTINGVSIVSAPQIGIDFDKSPHATLTHSSVGVSAQGATDPGRAGVYVVDSPGTTIGGAAGGAGNVIGGSGVGLLVARSADVTVAANSIGVTDTGAVISADAATGLIAFSPAGGSMSGLVLDGNTVAGTGHNLAVLGSGVRGARITHNRVGVFGTRRIGTPTDNIRVDGAPDATVESNTVAGADYDVLVAGSLQASRTDDTDGTHFDFHHPGDALTSGPATGTGDTIAHNTVGLVAAATPAGEGIRVWDAADDTSVDTNTVANHGPDEIQLSGGGHGETITDNTVGVDAAAPTGRAGIVLTDTKAVTVGGNTVGSVEVGVRVSTSSDAVLTGNTIGFGRDGASRAAVPTGVNVGTGSARATVGPGNVIGNADAALVLHGPTPTAVGNRIGVTRFGSAAAPNRTGILAQVGATDAKIGQRGAGNVVVNSLVGIDVEIAGTTVAYNTLGVPRSGPAGNPGSAGNNIGIVVNADASVHDNAVVASASAGIMVAATVVGTLRRNSVYGTADLVGIAGAPAAPTLVGAPRIAHGTSVRTFLVIHDLPATGTGTLEIFGNRSCADPEGRVPLFTTPTSEHAVRVISVPGRAELKGLTITYTDDAGRTSMFSACADAVPSPDSDGDGIPDLVEANAPSPSENQPAKVAFVGDNQQWVYAVAPTGAHFAGLAPIDDPAPTGHPGATFPVGLLSFRVEGVDAGATADVEFVLAGPSAVTSWTKYGPVTHFRAFGYEPSSDTGARVRTQDLPGIGLSTGISLRITDGGRGDDDAAADGVITDPGGPSTGHPATAGRRPPATSTTSPSAGAAVPSAASIPGNGVLARTGTDVVAGVRAALLILLLGFVCLLAGRARRQPRRRK